MEQKEIERLHKRGLLPDRYYYQLIDKPISEKLAEQKQKMLDRTNEKEIQAEIEEQLTEQVKAIFHELFKDFTI